MESRQIGVLIGAAIGLLIGIVLVTSQHSDRRLMPANDERTKIIKNQGFAYGFGVAVAWFVFFSVMDLLGIRPMENACIYLYGLLLGSGVSYCYIAKNNAYFALNEEGKKRFWTALLLVFALICIALGAFFAIFESPFNASGQLAFIPTFTLAVGIWELVIFSFVAVSASRHRDDVADSEM